MVEATLLRQVPKAGVRSILVGLLGRGIGPSRSPFMHEAEGRRLGMDYVYARFDFDAADLADSDLAEVLVAAERAGFSGANITHPFKQVAIGLTTRLSVEAEAIGAVNTIVFRNGERIGHNTDSFGFAESFRATLTGAQLGSALLLGAGGGGAAVAHALLGLGISRLSIFDPEESRSRALAGNLRSHFNRPIAAVGTPDIEARGLDGIVNASPVGMKKYPG
ncbi:MAG: shikimate dehydrogenase, partial [Cucumibacter sp.]